MERRDTTIEGRTYSILLPPVTQRMLTATRTATLLGPALSGLGAIAKTLHAESTSANWALLGDAFSAAVGKLDPEALHQLIIQSAFNSKLCCDSADICSNATFEKHFAQFPVDVYRVTLWVLWENVRDFFPNSATFIQVVKTKFAQQVPPVSPSPTGGPSTTG